MQIWAQDYSLWDYSPWIIFMTTYGLDIPEYIWVYPGMFTVYTFRMLVYINVHLHNIITPRRVCASGVKQSVVSVVVCRRLSYKKN